MKVLGSICLPDEVKGLEIPVDSSVGKLDGLGILVDVKGLDDGTTEENVELDDVEDDGDGIGSHFEVTLYN